MSPPSIFFNFFFNFFFEINHATSSNLYRSYYPHRSRDALSPVCGIFLRHVEKSQRGNLFTKSQFFKWVYPMKMSLKLCGKTVLISYYINVLLTIA